MAREAFDIVFGDPLLVNAINASIAEHALQGSAWQGALHNTNGLWQKLNAAITAQSAACRFELDGGSMSVAGKFLATARRWFWAKRDKQ